MSEYKLSSILTQGRVVHMAVIGCGGTGSAFASGLPYLHQAMRALGLQGLQVTLMDGDLISETNCVRQPFSRGEVGLRKSIVLASRCTQARYGYAYTGSASPTSTAEAERSESYSSKPPHPWSPAWSATTQDTPNNSPPN